MVFEKRKNGKKKGQTTDKQSRNTTRKHSNETGITWLTGRKNWDSRAKKKKNKKSQI
jgi:hypothetical protein